MQKESVGDQTIRNRKTASGPVHSVETFHHRLKVEQARGHSDAARPHPILIAEEQENEPEQRVGPVEPRPDLSPCIDGDASGGESALGTLHRHRLDRVKWLLSV